MCHCHTSHLASRQGLVSITASCHIISNVSAVIIGGVGSLLAVYTPLLLYRMRIDGEHRSAVSGLHSLFLTNALRTRPRRRHRSAWAPRPVGRACCRLVRGEAFVQCQSREAGASNARVLICDEWRLIPLPRPPYVIRPPPPGSQQGLFFGGGWGLFFIQLEGIIVIAVWTALTTAITVYLIRRAFGIRVSVEARCSA